MLAAGGPQAHQPIPAAGLRQRGAPDTSQGSSRDGAQTTGGRRRDLSLGNSIRGGCGLGDVEPGSGLGYGTLRKLGSPES